MRSCKHRMRLHDRLLHFRFVELDFQRPILGRLEVVCLLRLSLLRQYLHRIGLRMLGLRMSALLLVVLRKWNDQGLGG